MPGVNLQQRELITPRQTICCKALAFATQEMQVITRAAMALLLVLATAFPASAERPRPLGWAMDAMRSGNWMKAAVLAARDGDVAADVIEWHRLRGGGGSYQRNRAAWTQQARSGGLTTIQRGYPGRLQPAWRPPGQWWSQSRRQRKLPFDQGDSWRLLQLQLERLSGEYRHPDLLPGPVFGPGIF